MHISRILTSVALPTFFLLAATTSLGMTAAPESETDILVSSDGVSFAPSLSENLFDDMALLVPSESISSALWIKNPTGSPANVRVSLDGLDLGSGAFADNLTLTSAVEGSDTTRAATLRELDRCSVVVASQPLAGDATLKVLFTATLGDLDGLAGQNESTPIVFRIDMRDSEAGGFPPSPCTETGTVTTDTSTTGTTIGAPQQARAMAATGTSIALPLTVAGLLLSAGIMTVVARRRRPVR